MRKKLLSSLREAIEACGLGDGMTVSFHHHLRNGDYVLNMVMAEIAHAREVFAAIEEAKRQGKGAISLHGKMIDAPIVQRARLVLEAAAALEGGNADA